MSSEEIRKKFLEFFKACGHTIVPSSSLIPDDPSVLLTTAGMQQFKKYYTGELDALKDFGSKSTASIQKCFRTSDIDEVGDERHLTFFEMLGNFSFGYKPGEPVSPKGGYFKEKAIEYAFEFITGKEWMNLTIDYVTVFDPAKVPDGDWRKSVPRDDESRALWEKLGVKDIRAEGTDVFWGPTGTEGPCGPTTEIYVNGIEIWNIVFNQFYRDSSNKLTPLKIQGVDTGMGLERLAMVSQKVPTIFETDLFSALFTELRIKTANYKPYYGTDRMKRVIVDHVRASVFLIADGVTPSNKGAGYILRRLLRRIIVTGANKADLARIIMRNYEDFYPELRAHDFIIQTFIDESDKFTQTLRNGLNELEKMDHIDTQTAFNLYQTFGLPFEVIQDYPVPKTKYLNRELFEKEFRKHQEISRAGQEKKFGGHGLILDTGELKAGSEEELKKVLRLHTTTHLLQQALRMVLGSGVQQRGSDVTAERTRFDFSFDRKMTPKEIKKVEEIINDAIKKDLPVNFKEMPKEEAEKTGALYFFKEKYPEKVKVYYIGDSIETAFSKEFCGGPHVTHTGEIGKVKIAKEESVGAGVRRIRAVLN